MSIIKKIKKFVYKFYLKTKVFFGVNFFKKDEFSLVYDKRFFKRNIKLSSQTAKFFADYVIKNFSFQNVYDFGCGNGIYLKYFYERNFNVLGLDASQNASKTSLIPSELILEKDLRKKIDLNKKSDILICFEVAEHLPAKYADILVDNLTRHSDLIFFTAAKPGQGGTNHFNEQLPKYWIDKFEKRNFFYLKQETKKLKKFLKENNGVFWIVENLMIFKKN